MAHTKIDKATPPMEIVLPIIEERAVVDKEVGETGRVQVSTHVEELQAKFQEALRREDVAVERVAVNQVVDEAPAIRQEGDTTIYPIAQSRLEALGIIDLNHDVHSRETAGIDLKNQSSDHKNPGFWAGKGAAPPAEDRHLYEEALRRGGYLLTVDIDDAQASQVHEVLEGSKAVDIAEREQALKSTGFVPPPALVTAATASDEIIPVVEERLTVGRRQVDRRGVRVRAYVVEAPVSQQVELREEHVEVQRSPINVPAAGEDIFQEWEIELKETAEEAVISKQTFVTEEISVRKDAAERVKTVSDTVRHTEVEIEPIVPAAPNVQARSD